MEFGRFGEGFLPILYINIKRFAKLPNFKFLLFGKIKFYSFKQYITKQTSDLTIEIPQNSNSF